MIELLEGVTIVSCITRIILALFFGGIIGMEREKKGRPAGLRTYMLVCVGAALVMITNQFMVEKYPAIDPARMGAQVISGIGFLGAGTIIVTGKNRVKGLTTAAGLWAVACLGLTIGIGFYYGAIVGGICIIVVMEALHKIDEHVLEDAKVMTVYIEFKELSDIGKFMEFIKKRNINVAEMELLHQDCCKEDKIAVVFSLKLERKLPHSAVMEWMKNAEGVAFIEEV